MSVVDKMSIIFVTGPMCSGKSGCVIREARRHSDCILLSHNKHIRDGKDVIKSRTGETSVCIQTDKIIPYIKKLSPGAWIVIDEGHFFLDLPEACKFALIKGVNLFVSCIMFTSEMTPFMTVVKALAFATEHRTRLKEAYCGICGADAPYSSCRVSKKSDYLPDKGDMYFPTCVMCKKKELA